MFQSIILYSYCCIGPLTILSETNWCLVREVKIFYDIRIPPYLDMFQELFVRRVVASPNNHFKSNMIKFPNSISNMCINYQIFWVILIEFRILHLKSKGSLVHTIISYIISGWSPQFKAKFLKQRQNIYHL